ncbi:TraB/GumN family protein [Paenisporosarcina macmurdoensis]|uniref:TraB/GumN family protein n=1 Tax=Paenisporosarcina macmurdoensis TaxID=212659 RepID=A0ABW1L480_9BACL
MLKTTKYIFLLGIFIISTTACSLTSETVKLEEYFQDSSLEIVVRKELKSENPKVSEKEFATIQSLKAPEAGITNLEGIEKLTSLNYLDVTGNNIDDLSPLLSLEKLSEVQLGDIYFTGDSDETVGSVIENLEKKGVKVHVRSRLSFEEYDGPSEGIFHRVQKDNQTVYLLGSIHIGDQTIYPLNQKIDVAFEEADHLAVEINIEDINETEASQTMMQQGLYQDGTTLSTVVEDEVFKDTVGYLSDLGLNEEMINQFQPWFVTMMLSEVALGKSNLTSENGVDKHFITRATEKKLPIISLESVESQIASISSAPVEEQIESLEITLDSMDIYEEELTQLIRVWRSGNIDVIAQLRDLSEGSEQLAMDERDLLMADKIEGFLNADDGETYFVVVGALHLAGENSIVDLLETRGYSIESPGEF